MTFCIWYSYISEKEFLKLLSFIDYFIVILSKLLAWLILSTLLVIFSFYDSDSSVREYKSESELNENSSLSG